MYNKTGQSPPKSRFNGKSNDLPVVENVSCVLPETAKMGALYIGNYMGAQNVDLLKQRGIRAVLTTSVQTPIIYAPEHIPFHKRIEAHDRLNFSILDHFQQCLDFIERCRKVTSVFVHCFAGVSRSATIVIAYIMRCHNWTYDTALNFLKWKRIVVNPNESFANQLREYEKRLAQATRASSTRSTVTNTSKPASPPTNMKNMRDNAGQVGERKKSPVRNISPNKQIMSRVVQPTKVSFQQHVKDPNNRSISTEPTNTALQFKPAPSRVSNGPNINSLRFSNVANKKDLQCAANNFNGHIVNSLSLSNVGNKKDLDLSSNTPSKYQPNDNFKTTTMIRKEVKVMTSNNDSMRTPTKPKMTSTTMPSTPQKECPQDDSIQTKKIVRPRDLPGYRIS